VSGTHPLPECRDAASGGRLSVPRFSCPATRVHAPPRLGDDREGRGVLGDVGEVVNRAESVERDCPGPKPPFLAVTRPARPYKSTTERRFTMGNAKAA
jgi:hypothetical protein